MDIYEAFKQSLLTSNKAVGENWQETSSTTTSLQEEAVSETKSPQPGTSLLTISLGLICTALIVTRFKRFRFKINFNKGSNNLKFNHKASCCYSCRFFNKNSYLKCAVHPSKVLSIAAQSCPDYWSRDSDHFCNKM